VAAVLFASGAIAMWIGIRAGLVRRELRTSGGLLTGGKAMAAGALYVGTGLLGVLGGIAFALGG
jgi:hypothetical protein